MESPSKYFDDFSVYDVSDPETLLRSGNSPVGLKNIGNTCYFNSLIQTYFMIPKFINEILQFKSRENQEPQSQIHSISIKLIQELQVLFASMIIGNKKHIDPTSLLDCLVDEFGNKIIIGEQKDVGEFNMNFIARIDDAIKINNKSHEVIEVASAVSHLFYAHQLEIVSVVEENNQKLQYENKTLFGQLNLDIDQKELFRAWTKAYHNLIEEFITPSGYKTYAVQEIWPEELPGILLFQIQRVRYDSEANQGIKINSPFHFPLHLYGDRFMLKNKDFYKKAEEKILKIEAKIQRLEKDLKNIENFKRSGVNIIEVLTSTSLFLTDQLSLQNTANVPKESKENLCLTKKLLDQFQRVLKEQQLAINQKLLALDQKLESIFDRPELKSYEYLLHSILIHDGKANLGHYYAYIFDREENRWKKYSDTFIKYVDEDEVMKNAIGGSGESSAYCLIYIKKEFIERNKEYDCSFDYYSSVIPSTIRAKVLQENSKLIGEIEDYRAKNIASNIKLLYDNRFSQVIHWSTGNIPAEKQLINFLLYLRMNKNDNLSRWVLLNICTIELIGKSLTELEPNDILYSKINSTIINYSFGPRSIKLSDAESQGLLDHSSKYASKYKHARLAMYILDKLAREDFIPAFRGIMHHYEKITDPSDEYQKICLDSCKVLALRFTSCVNGCIYDKDIIQSLVWAKHLSFLCTVIGSFELKFVKILQNRVNASIDFMKRYLPSYFNLDIKLEYEGILNRIVSLVESPSFNVSETGYELDIILNEKIDPLKWLDHNESIAWNLFQVKRKYSESFIYGWDRLAKRANEKTDLLEQEIRDFERNSGINDKFI